jgi:hypothetical protein
VSVASLHRDDPRSTWSIHPTLQVQSWSFIIGASLFALGSAPWLGSQLGTVGANITFFIGAWFFTAGAFIQLALSGPSRIQGSPRIGLRAVWLAAAVQLLGTLLFNVSTGAALHARSARAERLEVWVPNAEGSAAFLISACIAMIPLLRDRQYWRPSSPVWLSTWFNMFGSIAFGVSAVGAIVLENGELLSSGVATAGTFVGALFFLATSGVMLPTARRGVDPENPGRRSWNEDDALSQDREGRPNDTEGPGTAPGRNTRRTPTERDHR